MHLINYAFKVKDLRLSKGLSQLDVELGAGLSPGSLSRLEKGHVNPSKETLWRLALSMRLDLEEMVELFGLPEVHERIKSHPKWVAHKNERIALF